jgi:hypothetical protein
MFQLVFSPNWFYGKDIIMDVIAVVIVILLGIISIRHYRLIGKTKKKHLYFGISFIMIALAFLAKIATNFTLYYKVQIIQRVQNVLVVQQVARASPIIFFTAFFLFHLLMLWGLYGLFAIISDEDKKTTVFFSMVIIAVLMYFTNHLYYVFHFMAFIILLLIVIKYQKNYLKTKNVNTRRLLIGFALLAISQAVFIFVKLSSIVYVAAEIIQLAGFLMLLITLILVLKHGKKKKSYRHHK